MYPDISICLAAILSERRSGYSPRPLRAPWLVGTTTDPPAERSRNGLRRKHHLHIPLGIWTDFHHIARIHGIGILAAISDAVAIMIYRAVLILDLVTMLPKIQSGKRRYIYRN